MSPRGTLRRQHGRVDSPRVFADALGASYKSPRVVILEVQKAEAEALL